MRISDWRSDVCSSDLLKSVKARRPDLQIVVGGCLAQKDRDTIRDRAPHVDVVFGTHNVHRAATLLEEARRSEEHTSELQSLMRIPYAVLGLKKKKYYGLYTLQITN